MDFGYHSPNTNAKIAILPANYNSEHAPICFASSTKQQSIAIAKDASGSKTMGIMRQTSLSKTLFLTLGTWD
eukprot:3494270-Karenia_brevis.AAC.1